MEQTPEEPASDQKTTERQIVAAIDVGATGIRMDIAELLGTGQYRVLESLKQPVDLGRDTFSTGRIAPETLEECVRILKSYSRLLREYGINQEKQIRAVATSSVREAENRDTFLDRIYIATRINVVPLEESEVNRNLYLAVRSHLVREKSLAKRDILVIEIGGGSTQLLLLEAGKVSYSDTYPLGSLRLRESLDIYGPPASRMVTLLDQEVQRYTEQIKSAITLPGVPVLVGVSGVAEIAASRLSSAWERMPMVRLDFRAFSAFAERTAPLPLDDLVQEFRISYTEAQTVAPALQAFVHLGLAFGVQEMWVPHSSMRDGLLLEMAAPGLWREELAEQILQSALTLGQKFHFGERHGQHVSDLSTALFRELQPDHQLDAHEELILRVSALLHDVGLFISNRSHHKHSMYLLSNSDLFGLPRQDMQLIALVARYHRRASPSLSQPEYAELDRDTRLGVAKMAAILRVADALDRNHLQQARDISFSREGGQFVITVRGVEDLSLERFALKQKGPLFEEVYGMPVVLRQGKDALTQGVPRAGNIKLPRVKSQGKDTLRRAKSQRKVGP